MVAVDVHAGLPFRWILGEGPLIITAALIVGLLLRAVPKTHTNCE
jgi:hypothetical protein